MMLASAAAVVVAIAVVARPWAAVAVTAVFFAVPPIRAVLRQAKGRDLIPVLGATGRLQLITGVLLAFGIAVSA